MQRLPQALMTLERELTALEQSLEARHVDLAQCLDAQQQEIRQSRTREAQALALAQKVSARLDQAIARIEDVLRD